MAQGLIEFALVLPLVLFLIFGVIELARIFQTWLSIQNGARFGARYAVTRQFDKQYCDEAAIALGLWADDIADGVIDCNVPRSDLNGNPVQDYRRKTEQLEDWARIPSIRDVTYRTSAAILRDDSVVNETGAGFFKVTICSTRDVDGVPGPDYSFTPAYPAAFESANCGPTEDAGGAGDMVYVVVDYTHPLVSPFLSDLWPVLRLTTESRAIVEELRTARVRNIPVTLSAPTLTPSLTTTPTTTETPTQTRTPTITQSPTITSPPTNTPTVTRTPTQTLTRTPTPTATQTPSNTPTSTPCPRPICTPTPTLTQTLIPSPTPSRTRRPTRTMTPTSTRTPTRTVTPIPTQTSTRTATPPVPPTLTPTVTQTLPPTPTFTSTVCFDC